ncbi:MAG: class I SAM-dependent methyltransferase [Thermoplasmata archaeon]
MPYLLLNWVNNQFPYTRLDGTLVIRDFVCEDLGQHWHQLDKKRKPSRCLSDLFWMRLSWDKIKEELTEINVVDTGCGSGIYGKKLLAYSNNGLTTYTGIDISRDANWAEMEDEYPNFRFCVNRGTNFSESIPEGANFFMTQSAIEHFNEDLSYFEQIRDYTLSYGKSVIQVHLFPSSYCLWLYLWHGARQYTPRTVSKITRLFRDSSYAVLFRLGGRECNRLHYEFITKPLLIHKRDLRDSKAEEYERRLRVALERDMEHPQKHPAFLALVIHSNWSSRIF